MRKIFQAGLVLAMLVIAQLSAHATARPLTTFKFSEGQKSQTIEQEGVKVTIKTSPDDEWTSKAIAAIEAAEFPLALVDLGSTNTGFDYEVGVGKISADAVGPSVIIKQFTGGAHCCLKTTIIYPRSGEMVSFDFGMRDAVTDFAGFPNDIDGDGTADFVVADDAFLYAFTNYAASMAPPKIINFFKGNVIDVSNEQGFRHIFEDFSHRSKLVCADQNNEYRNGACAAFVASEARLGRLDAALNFADENAYNGVGVEFPSDCRVAYVDYRCPENEDISFTTFYAAVRWFLRKHDYM